MPIVPYTFTVLKKDICEFHERFGPQRGNAKYIHPDLVQAERERIVSIITEFAPSDRINFDESMFIHNNLGSFSLIPKNATGRTLGNTKESMTVGIYLSQDGSIPFRPMFVSKSFPRSKRNKKTFTEEYIHERQNQPAKTVTVNSEEHEKFMIYRNSSGWNERGILVKELEMINSEMKKQNRKICFLLDHAPCHLLGKNPLPDLTNIKLVYIEKNMTDKLQENFINY